MDANVLDTARRFVSLHAVTRYCERFLGVSMKNPSGIGPLELAELYCAAAGTTIEAVQERLYSPTAQRGLETGAPYFATGGVGYRVGSNGVIVTVVKPHSHDTNKLKMLSDRELRHKLSQINRRFRAQRIERELQ